MLQTFHGGLRLSLAPARPTPLPPAVQTRSTAGNAQNRASTRARRVVQAEPEQVRGEARRETSAAFQTLAPGLRATWQLQSGGTNRFGEEERKPETF